MDTLIDNRKFPLEMQDHLEPEKEKSIPWLLLFLVALATGIIVFLVSRMFFLKKVENKVEPAGPSIEERRQVVNNFKNSTLPLTEQQRQERIEVFFNQ